MDPLEPGDPGQVGAYRLVGRLGEGGMGQVFLGKSPGGRQVAVKLILPEHADLPAFRARFAREVEAAKRVGGFHTAPVVDADPDADPPWMVTAYIPGPSLASLVTRRGPLPVEEVRALGGGLAEGLAAIHSCGLVHRDMKPANVIMAEDGPRIIDFGIARILDDRGLTATGAVLGTYAYMSPEQVRGDDTGPASDVFSLGSILAYAAVGEPPFGAGPVAVIVHNIIARPPRLLGLPPGPELTDVITACLAKNPADRPTVADVLSQLTTPDAPGPQQISPVTVQVPPHIQGSPGFPSQQAQRLAGSAPGSHVAAQPATPSTAETVVPVGLRPSADTPPTRQEVDQPHTVRLAPTRTITRRGVLLAATVTVPTGAVLYKLSSPSGGGPLTLRGKHALALYDLLGGDAVFSRDGRILAARGARDERVRLWEVTTGKNTVTITDPNISQMAVSPNGQILATGGGLDGKVRLWEVATGKNTTPLPEIRDNYVASMAFSPDGKTLATGTGTDTLLWDVETRKRIGQPLTARATSIAFSPDGKTLATGTRSEGAIRLWNVATSHPIVTLPRQFADSIAFSPDSKTLATGGRDSLVFRPDRKTLATSGSDSTDLQDWKIRLWEVTTGQLSAEVSSSDVGAVIWIKFNPDGKTITTLGQQEVPGNAEIGRWAIG